MADIVLTAVTRGLLDALIGASARATIEESLGVPGARSLGRLASWTKDEEDKDIPELALNSSLLVETFLQLFASGLGTLAFVWATVVLLGGFSTLLYRMDFWFITAIVFVETARIVGYNSGLEAKFFIDVPAAFSQSNNILPRLTSVPTWIAQAPIVAAIACITLSIMRLVGIAKLHSGGTDASNSNLKPALILFYALVLTQGALFFLWFYVARYRWVLAVKLKDYFKNTEVAKLTDGIKLMDRYVTATLDTCIEKGVVSTLNRTLVSFAAELLQSEYNGDHLSAVSVLYVVITRKERTAGVVHQICASEKFAGRLFQLIRLKSPLNREIQDAKAYAAEIVAKLACNLCLANIPEAAPSISSLLDGRLMETAAQTEFPGENQIVIDTDSGPKGKPLFVHGLLILGELAGGTENRREICQDTDLVSKILAPVSHGLPKFIGNDSKTVQIVEASLVLVAKLTSDEGETGTTMCSEISKDKRIAENLLWILQKSDGMKSNGDHEMEILALEILTRLSLDDATGEFIGMLGDLLSHVQDSPLKMPAVRALNALAADHGICQLIICKQGRRGSLIQQLIDITRNDANSEYRAVTAELLAQICANSTPDQDRDRLKPVSGSLSTVLQAILVGTTNYTQFVKNLQEMDAETTRYAKRRKDLQLQLATGANKATTVSEYIRNELLEDLRAGHIYRQVKVCDEHLKQLQAIRDETRVLAKCSRRFIFPFLSLALEICDKLGITANALTNVLATLQMDDRAFAQKLMEIVVCLLASKKHDDDADLACLKIMKTTTKLATWMMRTNCSYIRYFQQENILEKLHRGMQAMRDLERDMVLTSLTTREIKDYKPLQSLVEDARALVWPQQR